MNNAEVIPHLFRTEYTKIVSVLTRRFGFAHLEIAEDIASDTFMTATQSWGLEGIPENPTAWLYLVAKNKAKNYLQREFLFQSKIAPELKAASLNSQEPDIDLSSQNIKDSQLQMMFAICHPSLSEESQVGLSLRILCGFGIEEIADAFLTTREVINKRLYRAKEKLREGNIQINIISDDTGERLPVVLKTIYLLFNEGYYSISQNRTLRKDLCLEALRLCTMLIENESTNMPEVNALLALMCFHFSRFDARISEDGHLVLYDEQDVSLWKQDFIAKGGYFLSQSAAGNSISKYHLEAGIAYWNTQKNDTTEKWENILQLYNQLLQIEYSPIAALNRTYALAKARDKQSAILEAKKLGLTENHFYFVLLGELYTDIDNKEALRNFKEAATMARSQADKAVIQKKIHRLTHHDNV